MTSIFVIMILSTLFLKKIKYISLISILGTAIITFMTLDITEYIHLNKSLSLYNNFIYLDSLSIIQLLIITLITFIALIYSHTYIKNELEENIITLNTAKLFYFMIIVFYFAMMFVSITNNIIAMWIAIEATTLSTAFLIGFNQNKLSLEAAWKYVIICSIGISLGFVGIIIFIYSAGSLDLSQIMNWTYLVDNAGSFNKITAQIAFTFIFIGIGTKAGLAPMHTWLPDGHSEAPSPISAMMSGILLNLALYMIIRFYIIIKMIDGLTNMKYLFIAFGCLSLLISAFSILKQTNYKRLLAFSSVENIGIISLGIGIGGPIGIFGALLHSLIHAVSKSLLFLVSGNILSQYKTKRIDRIERLIKTMPVNSIFLILGILAITGVPPFASFFSEYRILVAGITEGHYLAAGIFAFCLLLVFVGFINILFKMIFNGKAEEEYVACVKDKENVLPLYLTFILILYISFSYQGYLVSLIEEAAAIIL